MKKQEYRSFLGQLPIKSPTLQDMVRLCPHLTIEEVTRVFMDDASYVACPPLYIKNAFQIITYYKEWVETITVKRIKDGEEDASVTGNKNHPATLRWSFAGRTRKSYADGKAHGDVFGSYKYKDKAMKFAEENWGDELVLDDWVDVGEFYIQDPTDLVNDRYHNDSPRTKAVLHIAWNRDFNEIINDHSKPQSVLFDEAISQMTLDQIVWHEIKGGRGGYMEYNCAHCGAGLHLSSCSGCGYEFRDDQFRCGWSTPLSKKMVSFLFENGHQFKVDPSIAWEKELQEWKQYHCR